MIDLQALKALDAVVTEKSFEKAAKKLNKVQTAVSYQIKKLEQQLGVELLDRSKYRAALTPIGTKILNEGKKLLAQSDYLEHLAQQANSDWEDSLTIVMDGVLPKQMLISAINQLNAMNIATEIHLQTEYLSGVHYYFSQTQADLMIVQEYDDNPFLKPCALPHFSCLLVCHPDYPLAKLSTVEQFDLQSYTQIIVNDSHPNQGKRHIEKMRLAQSRVMYVSDFTTKYEMLLNGLGYGWMPEHSISLALQKGKLQHLTLAQPSSFIVNPMLIQHKQRKLGKAAQFIIEYCTK